MKLRKQAFVSFTCALALVGNSLTVFAQDKAQEKTSTQTQVQRKVTVKTPDGQTQEINVEGDGGTFVTADGKKVQVRFSSNQDGTLQTGKVKTITGQDGKEVKVVTSQGGQFVVTPGAGGTATFHSQDGATHNLDGQNYTFVRGGNGQDFTYNFVSSEMSFDNKLVKGAPFTADTENESVKTLADGNRIVHKNSGSIARDGEGRTRRENTINAIGNFSGNESAKTVTLHDPIAGTMFILEPHTRTARKMGGIRSIAPQSKGETPPVVITKNADLSKGVLQGFAVKRVNPWPYPPAAKAAKVAGIVQVQVTISEEGKVIDATALTGHPLLRDAAVEAARQWEFKPTEASGTPVKAQSTLTFNFTLQGEENNANNSNPAQAPKKINVSGGVLQGSAIKRASPTYPPIAKAAKAAGAVQVQVTISEEGKVIDATALTGHPLLRDAAVEAARQWEFKPTELSGQPVRVQGILTFNFTLEGEDANINDQNTDQSVQSVRTRTGVPTFNSNTESLGKQMIEGIEAEGKRTVTTIPVGAIGNERAIEIVSESWFSPELQTVIMSKRTDPTSGETTYRLTNIRRGEPDASLFQVPSDYTVKEGPAAGAMGVGGTFIGTPTMQKRTPNNQ